MKLQEHIILKHDAYLTIFPRGQYRITSVDFTASHYCQSGKSKQVIRGLLHDLYTCQVSRCGGGGGGGVSNHTPACQTHSLECHLYLFAFTSLKAQDRKCVCVVFCCQMSNTNWNGIMLLLFMFFSLSLFFLVERRTKRSRESSVVAVNRIKVPRATLPPPPLPPPPPSPPLRRRRRRKSETKTLPVCYPRIAACFVWTSNTIIMQLILLMFSHFIRLHIEPRMKRILGVYI